MGELEKIKLSFDRGCMRLEDIEWLIKTVEHQKKHIQELESEIVVLRNVNNSI